MDSTPAPMGGEVDGLEAGGAHPVDARARDRDGEARDQGGGAPDVHALLARLRDAAHDHVLDLRGVYARALDEAAQGGGRQDVGPRVGQAPAALADGRARRV
jgi:hypothetical protein